MRTFLLLSLASISTFYPLYANAVNWEDVGVYEDLKIHYFIDFDSVYQHFDPVRLGREDVYVSAIVRHEFTDGNNLRNKGFSHSLNNYIVNCTRKNGGDYFISNSLTYNSDNQIVDGYIDKNYSNNDFKTTVVDTAQTGVVNNICMRNIFNINTGKYPAFRP